ncbi:Gfo/Idh/MocA family oxidoreductase [Sphingomonas sp. BIUV-7]|uniref:Gfo/Idh/MocA family oxidoreductase n=2 Tax=Sphingomonas natans TaxID=3063330 RepID=A0ABT8Y893_9SPHN|nr:Gfo/Idh/MocA family oxidoreductase [Sphingomonas sp. BIUV-7]
MTKKLRVGIVSANWGAVAHLPAWRTLCEDVEVTAICTSRRETAEAAAQQFAVDRPFWDFEAMCADPEIDLIDAGTNPVLREKIVTAALTAGKHVVNQMPFAASAAGARRLEALRADQGRVGAAAASLLGLPHLALMKEMVEAGEIGEVLQVHCSWHLSFFLQIMPGFPYTWFGKAGLGVSVTRNHGSHMLHALRHLFGPIQSVSSHIQTMVKTWAMPDGERRAVETDDTAHALLSFANGTMGTLTTSWVGADSPGFSLEAMGTKGRLHLTALRYPSVDSAQLYAGGNSMTLAPDGAVVPVPSRLMMVSGRPCEEEASDLLNGGQRISLARLFSTVVSGIRTGSTPLPSFARAAEVQGLIEALYAANERRAWVDTAAYLSD